MSNVRPATALELQGEAPPTYLGWAIASMALCFLPFGVLGAVYGWRAAKAAERGDGSAAMRSSRVARRWIIASAVCGLLLDLLIVAALGLLGAFPAAGPQ